MAPEGRSVSTMPWETKSMEPTKSLCVTVVVIVIVVVANLGRSERREVAPLLIEYPLELLTSRANRSTSGIEGEAVLQHELEVVVKALRGRILPGVELLPDGRKIHGFLDNLWVRWKIHFDPIDGLVEGMGDVVVLLLV